MNMDSLPSAIALLRRQLEAAGARDIGELTERLQAGQASEQEWVGSAEQLLRADPLMATGLLEAATAQLPESIQLSYLLGNAHRMCAKKVEAEASLRKALALDPSHVNASLSLVHLLREQGRMRAVADVMLALWKNEPRSHDSDLRTLAFLCECERFAEADALAGPIIEAHPDDPRLLRRAGEIALVLGRFDEAGVHLRKTLTTDPTQASAWLRLAHTHRFIHRGDPDLALLREGAARNDLAEDVDTAIGFALGKALDDLGEVEKAAAVLEKANSRWRTSHPWNAGAWRQFVDSRLVAPALNTAAPAGEPVPVFIVGLPRSGTTLTASLLARDAQIRNRGELNWIPVIASRLDSSSTADVLAAAGRYFMTQLRQDDTPARFYIDKNPLNFRYLDLISAMLPQARIIHCRRDQRDTALSIWSQHFAHDDMSWSYDFDDITEFIRGYQRLMSHWQAVMPQRIFELDYEALVTDTDATLARLREFIGLDPAATMSNSGSGPNEVIATASVWQARQKIHGNSVNRWQSYLRYLPKLGGIVNERG